MRQKQRNSVNVLIAGDAFVDGIIDVSESIEISAEKSDYFFYFVQSMKFHQWKFDKDLCV